MKVLVLTSRFPYPLEKGDKLRIYHQLKQIAKEHEVILISLSDQNPSKQDLQHLDELVSKHYVFNLNKWSRGISLLKGWFGYRPLQNAYFFDSSIKREIQKVIDQERPDFIHCHLIRMVDYIRESDIKKSLDYMDSFSAGALKRSQNSKGLEAWIFKNEYKRTRKYESEIFKDFDRHFIISEQDRDSLDIRDKQKIDILRNGIDTHFFYERNQAKKFDIGFIGNLGYYSNVYAVNFIIEELMPKLDSETKVLFAGARPSKQLLSQQSNQLTVKAWMEDIRDAYADIKIFVAPLFKGIGQQNKILEAMSMGVPVVCTTSVNNAIKGTPGKHLLVADSPEEFVKQINRLRNDAELNEHIRLQAKAFVNENYSWESKTVPLLDFFKT